MTAPDPDHPSEEPQDEAERAELNVSAEDARRVAGLLRYAVSLNTAAGLVSPTRRRLATPTYRAAEIAALVLEGRGFEEAVQEAAKTWTGSLQDDHRHALAVLQNGETFRQDMAGRLTPEELAEHLEIPNQQFLELLRPNGAKGEPAQEPEN